MASLGKALLGKGVNDENLGVVVDTDRLHRKKVLVNQATSTSTSTSTHFAWPSFTYVETCGIHTLLGSVVRLYIHIVIQTLYTCMLSLLVHILLGPVIVLYR